MKIEYHSTPIAAILLAAAISASAATFDVVLPTPPPNSIPPGLGRTLLIDPFDSGPAPGLFLGTEKYGAGVNDASIYKLTPVEETYSAFNIQPVDFALRRVSKILYSPVGSLYAVGFNFTATGPKNKNSVMSWKVRYSQNQGVTWNDTDTYHYSAKTLYTSFASAAVIDNLGNLYVAGIASDGRLNHWTIRRKTVTGPWSVVYDTTVNDGINQPFSMCFFPGRPDNPALAPAVFVVGILNNRWTVLRSHNGLHWQVSDNWPENPSIASAWNVVCDSRGNLYVCGVRGYDGNNQGWVLRKSVDGGSNWIKLLDIAEGGHSWAAGLAVDSSGNVTLSGATHNPSGSPRWVIVRNAPGENWNDSWTARLYPLGQSTVSKGRGIATDTAGNIFLAGDVIDWTDDGNIYSGTHVGLLRMLP